ncbi:MAG: hypothetical protein ABEJ31_13540 [Haloarculaceae archaeon]
MSNAPSAIGVERSEDYYHVRYRDPDDFDEIRTPDWAANAANSVAEGAEVRTGHESGGDDWTVQSVLVPTGDADRDDQAQDLADRIVAKLND